MAEPTVNDRSTVNLVVLLVGAATLASILGVIVLRFAGKDVSDIVPIVTLGLGALAGLLANTKSVDVGGLQQLADAQKPPTSGSAAQAARPAFQSGRSMASPSSVGTYQSSSIREGERVKPPRKTDDDVV